MNDSILLIVPYGIETSDIMSESISSILLIVPYGIETKEGVQCRLLDSLLIVPYGIETFSKNNREKEMLPF